MARKTVALFVLAAFCLFELSCASAGNKFTPRRTVKLDPAELGPDASKLKIVSVVLKTGQSVAFREKEPAWIPASGDSVVGRAFQNIWIENADIRSTSKDKKGRITAIETSDGRTYEVLSSWAQEDRIRISGIYPVTIPLADVQQVWIMKTHSGGSAVLVVAVVLAAAAGVALTAILLGDMKDSFADAFDSCPFVYSYTGHEYALDAEPYGTAISEGLKRTDWAELSNLREVNGKYRLLLANEFDETQYTDELKLLVVDHAPGVKIAPDLSGRIHTFENPRAPLRAMDQKGRDILTFVAENDKVFWLSRLEEKDPETDADLRDELLFEFPKPTGAKRARLLANVWTTQWGSLSAGKFMELYGSSLPEQYEDVDRHGPTYDRFLAWMANEELYALKVWVETGNGWKTRGTILGGAPVIAEDRACVLDVGDVPGEVLRIRLRPPVNFWMVNSLAVDYGEDSPIRVTELAAERAVDWEGRDVRAELASADGSYLVSPNRGERAELVFAAPPAGKGLERTVLVKASGYYRAHLEAEGEPQTETIERVLGEPGFAARYSFREYRKWEAGLRAGQAAAER